AVAVVADTNIPSALVNQIRTENSAARVPSTQDFRDGWSSALAMGKQPYLLQGDFNGDGKPDFALILLETNGWRVKAYHLEEGGHYTSFNLEDFGSDPGYPTAYKPQQFELVLVKKGEILRINNRPVSRAH